MWRRTPPRARTSADPVAAEDDDGDMLTYTLGGVDVASFAIDEDTGQIMTMASLDFENEGQLQGRGHGHVTRHGEERHHHGDDHRDGRGRGMWLNR